MHTNVKLKFFFSIALLSVASLITYGFYGFEKTAFVLVIFLIIINLVFWPLTIVIRHQKLSLHLDEMSKKQHQLLMKFNEFDTERKSQDAIISELKIVHQLIERLASESIFEPDTSKTEDVFFFTSPKGQDKSNPFGREQLLFILKDALKNDRIDMLLQPIVSLPQRKVRFFETFSQIRDQEGGVIIADHYIPIAKEESIIRLVDHLLLFRCLQLVRKTLKKNYEVGFFCNLSLLSLSDKSFLDSLVEFISENRSLATAMIFEFDQEALTLLQGDLKETLKHLASFGCRFSVDHIKDLTIDLPWLVKNGFKFIKIDGHVFLQALDNTHQKPSLQEFKKQADALSLDIILTKIETEADLINLLEYNFDFGQGYLFSAPRTSTRW